VRSVKRDKRGNIVALCNSEAQWSPRRKAQVIRDILDNKTSYYVQEQERRSYVRVLDGETLRTTRDTTSENSLENLSEA
jgi:hypothetical protein